MNLKLVINVSRDKTDDISEIARSISKMPKLNNKRQRIVIITQGDKPVCVAIGHEVKYHNIIKLEPEQIVDTNGAGDSFVGLYSHLNPV